MDTNDVTIDQILNDDPSQIVTRALLAATTTESADLQDPGELSKWVYTQIYLIFHFDQFRSRVSMKHNGNGLIFRSVVKFEAQLDGGNERSVTIKKYIVSNSHVPSFQVNNNKNSPVKL